MKKHVAIETYTNKKSYFASPVNASDYLNEEQNKKFLGIHMLIDMWEPQHINDVKHIETALQQSISAANATLLHMHLHKFATNGGISGVAVLAESHISVHTWPEKKIAAFDIFTCGKTDPHAAADALKEAFLPKYFKISKALRG